MNQLLAKKTPANGMTKSLVDHTRDVVDAAQTLFGSSDCPSRLGREWLRFFRLDLTHWHSFYANLLAASLFHDWGKANEGMQKLLAGGSGGQLFRHEHLMLCCLGTTAWTAGCGSAATSTGTSSSPPSALTT